MSFWEAQTAAAQMELAQTAGRVGRAIIDNARGRREAAEFARQTRDAYLVALERAKITGEMPVEFQNKVPTDELIASRALVEIFAFALSKSDPNHPLVNSPELLKALKKKTLVKLNRLGRPKNISLADVLPNITEIEKAFDQFR